MACTELFGMITVSFDFIRYAEHRLKLIGSFNKKTIVLSFLLIKFIAWINEWVWLVGVIIMATPIRSGLLLTSSSTAIWQVTPVKELVLHFYLWVDIKQRQENIEFIKYK